MSVTRRLAVPAVAAVAAAILAAPAPARAQGSITLRTHQVVNFEQLEGDPS